MTPIPHPFPLNPWIPNANPYDQAVHLKLHEELGECCSASARCSMQGIDEVEPVTGKSNRRWFEEELADAAAVVSWAIEHFKLDESFIEDRMHKKLARFHAWHELIEKRLLSEAEQAPVAI